MVKRISSGSRFEELAGYSRAVISPDPGGDWVFVSGTTGYDYRTMTISPDVVEQTRQTFRNIASALHAASASLDDVVQLRVYLADRADFERVAPVIGEYMRKAKPTNTTLVAGFVTEAIRIEIEAVARLPVAGR
jgi:enamine deaminase RidA (YjgF/YER057c/UK114 family)